jgi:hypothetical protein
MNQKRVVRVVAIILLFGFVAGVLIELILALT